MTEPVETVDRSDMLLSRREIMAGSSVVAGAAVLGAMPRKVAAQEDPDNEISGTVTDSGGPAQGATVVAVPHDESLDPLVTTTDANGDYLFDNGDLYEGEELYHVIARDGAEADPRRGQQNYPFIAAEGGPAIPDSEDLHARYDATALSLSDQDSVTTWGDETGNGHDLAAGNAPTFRTAIINGNAVVRFDGADDFLDATWSELSQPNTIFLVAKYNSGVGTIFDGPNSNARNQLASNANGEWTIFAGSNPISGSANDTNSHVFSALFNGASSYLRIDGTQDLSGDPGADGLDDFRVGKATGTAGDHADVDIGEILVYPEDKSGIQGDVEQYLADKWGVTL